MTEIRAYMGWDELVIRYYNDTLLVSILQRQ